MNLPVLVVDDDEVNRAVAIGMLAQLGCTSEIAVDGIEAVQAATRRSYAAILMDCMMPRMDGCHATRAIRGHEQRRGLPRVPIIGVSALAADEDRRAALGAGMDAYLVKPLSQQALAAELRSFAVGVADRPPPPPEAHPDAWIRASPTTCAACPEASPPSCGASSPMACLRAGTRSPPPPHGATSPPCGSWCTGCAARPRPSGWSGWRRACSPAKPRCSGRIRPGGTPGNASPP